MSALGQNQTLFLDIIFSPKLPEMAVLVVKVLFCTGFKAESLTLARVSYHSVTAQKILAHI